LPELLVREEETEGEKEAKDYSNKEERCEEAEGIDGPCTCTCCCPGTSPETVDARFFFRFWWQG